MVDFEYESLLERARERIPKNISERSRWTMPEPEILIEGNQTILRNFSAIVDAMDRDANHVYQFLINELGTSGNREQVRVLFKGRVPPKRIKEKIVLYVKTYILCNQCRAPDTRFIKDDRTTLLKCQACGATRPVRLWWELTNSPTTPIFSQCWFLRVCGSREIEEYLSSILAIMHVLLSICNLFESPDTIYDWLYFPLLKHLR